jgi:hypothetical protein
MQIILQALATLASLLGPTATILDLVRSKGARSIAAALAFVTLIGIVAWAFHTRRRIASSSVEIEGISIDSVNAANIRRRVNRSLMVHTADHTAIIDGPDLNIAWRYSGYCRTKSETAMEFSVDSARSIAFGDLDCRAYDLRRDPHRLSPIRPSLIGPDSISKKLAVPFLAPLTCGEPFDVMLECHLPMTYSPGTCYYTSTLSFDRARVGHCTVTLRFLRARPPWVRVYELGKSSRPKLVKSLHPLRNGSDGREYRDVAENVAAKSTRIYIFKLDTI